MNFRRARLEDLDEIMRIEELCFKPSERFSRETYESLLSRKEVAFIVAEIDGRIVGFVAAEARGLKGYVYTINVHPEYQGKGIGKALMKEMETRMRDVGVRIMELEVRVDNKKAVKMYESLGYSTVFFLPSYYGPGKNGYLMRKRISEE
ncbi:MAG: ribosomal protein S18-alanine N-acetyltransferase [Candidatus Methanodesulfokora washburnensis]